LRDGVLVVDKPQGRTSHDVVDHVRRSLQVKRAGHTGTLDPFATGVLPICLGKAARLARFLGEGDKEYRATVRLGFATSTDDLEGEPLGQAAAVSVDPPALAEACASLTGRLLQVPPAFSAKRVGGRRLYDLARGGERVEPRPAPVVVHALEVRGVDGDRLEIEVRCSRGTYVRALARDLGARLGCGGHLVALRRLRSGEFDLERAVTWEGVPEAGDHVLPLRGLLTGMPAVLVGPEGREAVRHGRSLGAGLVLSGFPAPGTAWVRVQDEGGDLLAVAECGDLGLEGSVLPVEPLLHPRVVLL
jgi:tRNA pseudouridine55 synthase